MARPFSMHTAVWETTCSQTALAGKTAVRYKRGAAWSGRKEPSAKSSVSARKATGANLSLCSVRSGKTRASQLSRRTLPHTVRNKRNLGRRSAAAFRKSVLFYGTRNHHFFLHLCAVHQALVVLCASARKILRQIFPTRWARDLSLTFRPLQGKMVKIRGDSHGNI